MNNSLLVFTENYARGGGNRYMVDLVNAVTDDFAEIVLASNTGGIFADDFARLSRPVMFVPAAFITRARIGHKLLHMPRMVRRVLLSMLILLEPFLLLLNLILLAHIIKRVRPSRILVCNGGYPAAQACLAMTLAARLRGVSAALSIVSMPSPRRLYMWPYERLLDALVWHAAAVVLVNAEAIAIALTRMRDMPPSRAVVVHNGIDDAAAAIVDPHADAFVIGCVTRLDVMKGVLVLLDAFSRLAMERADLRLVLAGDGDAAATVASRIRERGLHDKVALLGHFSGDVDVLLRSFDVFAFPSLWEGFPYSIVEAMRSERAIVATRVGGIPEAIADGREGLLVKAGDTTALAAALRRMIDDAALRQACASAARSRFVHEFSLSEMHRRAKAVLMGAA